MKPSTIVHWQEGLLLQPHHLQVMQRGMLDRFADRQLLTRPYPYGVLACEVSEDALHNNRLEFTRLDVLFRSGRHLRIPQDTLLPPLDLTPRMEAGPDSLTISVALPYWTDQRANVAAPADGADQLYCVNDTEVPDENSGINPQLVAVRVPNARLIVNDDGSSRCETMPVVRIRRGTGEQLGKPTLDREFYPPSYVAEGCADLRRILQGTVDQIEASRREVVALLVQDEFSGENLRPAQIVPLLKLRTLNRSAARLGPLVRAGGVSPFQWYLELRDVLAELVGLNPREDEMFEAMDYHHENLGPVMLDLCNRLRSQLVNVTRSTVLKVEFAERDGVLVAGLTEEHLTKPNEYFLGIQTNGDPTALSRLVEDPDQFKLMARSRVLRAVRGLRLLEQRQPGPELPRRPGLFYYRVDRASEQSVRAWADVVADPDRTLAIKRPAGVFADAHFTLFMAIP